jgi:hypothetical protein
MAWTYSLSKQELSNSSATWRAVSGPQGNGALPFDNKQYLIGRTTDIEDIAFNTDFKDPAGNVWWCPITPQFATGRKGFGIHPDGGTPGTKGCIGLSGHDTSSAKRALSLSRGEILTVTP